MPKNGAKKKIIKKQKKLEDGQFNEAAGLAVDALNAFHIPAASACYLSDDHPAELYEKYIQRRYPNAEAKYIMKKSDPKAIAAFNLLVDEFNSVKKDIRERNDDEALKNFIFRIRKLLMPSKKVAS